MQVMQQGRNLEANILPVREAAELANCSDRAIRKACAEGRLKAERTVGNGGTQYRIDLDSLVALYDLNPIEVARWQAHRLTGFDMSPEGDKARALAHNERELKRAREAVEAGEPAPRLKLAPVAIEDLEEIEALWERFNRATPTNRDRATKAVAVLMAFERMKAEGKKIDSEIIPALRVEYENGVSKATLWRWRRAVQGQRRDIWAPLLLADWQGKLPCEIPEAVWSHFMEQWGTTSGASDKACYDRTVIWAKANGFESLPSCDTFRKRLKQIPLPVRVKLRQGEKALEELYPSMRRNYLSLKVHEMWCSDGHVINVHCRWPDGYVGRPVMVAWVDLRTRVFLGWRVDKSENADIIRLAFMDAARTAQALPEVVYLDNGRAFTDKGNTGGTPTRYRGKVLADDPTGLFASLAIPVDWSKPRNGREKPLESHWRVIADRTARRPEFVGAYCGKDALSKPEDFDKAKAVPIELILEAIAEELEMYHNRANRGDGMDGRAPREVYEELIQHTPVRTPTARQLSACLKRRESVKPDRNGVFTILGNKYWSEATVALERVSYTVAYDPDDLHADIEISKGDRFMCTAQIKEKSGFRDRSAMREYRKTRNEWKKSIKQQAKAALDLVRAELAMDEASEAFLDTQAKAVLPVPKVVAPVRTEGVTMPPLKVVEDDTEVLSDEEIERRMAAARATKLRAASGM